jgi:choline dehydrogenase-like flavoprotein
VERVIVVGSGASAVHFTLSLLERGREVVMLDVGRTGPEAVRPDDSFQELKANLVDPAAYFLGEHFETVTYPGAEGEYYGFPPGKTHVFAELEPFRVHRRGFEPLISFAQGGLAEAWTGGAFPFHPVDFAGFPLSYEELEPYYDVVAERIGIAGCEDDLARFLPVHEHLLPPLDLDEHSRVLLESYASHRQVLNARGFTLGRSRVAALSADRGERKACDYSGRCLTGCPTGSLYVPSLTLRRCREFPGFTYLPGRFVRHFTAQANGRITRVVATHLESGEPEEHEVDRLVLGAGTLASGKIFLDSLYRARGEIVRLKGLMDNRQVLMPFVNLRLIRRPYDPDTYQYHQLAIALVDEDPRHYVHGLVTTLKTASIHPIVQNLPVDFRTGLYVFRNLHAALGLVNANFPDTRRDGNSLTLRAGPGGETVLEIRYRPPVGERAKVRAALRRLRACLFKLGCVVPPGMSHVRPMGASVHYAGTLPMSEQERPLTTSRLGRSHDFENLYFVDGTTFPFLPAKNLTFTLMANAARIAAQAF